jgi:uroporphyrinogen decarboxylase
MIEGHGSQDFRATKRMLYSRPDLLHRILDLNAQAVAAYLNAQMESGVQAVMLFDTWGGALSPTAFHEFSLPYLRSVLKACAGATSFRAPCSPRAAACGLESLADSGADCVGLD